MAIKRQGRFYSQERLAVPAIRDIESAVSADFDSVLRDMIAGTSTGYILSGFTVNIGVSTFSQSADNLTLNSLNGKILNTTAIESGTLLKVTGSTAEALNTSNARISGSFIAGSTNYVSINYIRKADTSTDTVYFYDKNADIEFSKLLPVATLLDYQIVINTTGFDVNVPVAIIQTNSGNVPTQITDSRYMLFRLGTGGLTPNQFYSYPWLSGRTEPGTATTSSGTDPFTGADKNITTFKEWMDAMMTSIKEIKGSSYWFSTGSSGSGGLSLQTVNDDANLSVWTGLGTLTHNLSTTGQIISSANINIRNMVTDSNFVVESFTKSLADGEVLFLNLTRYSDITGNVTFVPSGTLPGSLVGQNNLVVQASSVGQFTSLTNGSPYGDWIKSKNDNPRYFRQVSAFYNSAGSVTNSTNATYILLDSSYNITGASTGIQQAHYNQGYHGQSVVLTSSKVSILGTYNIQNVYWLAHRSSDSVYVRNMGRFVPGEVRAVNENTATNVLNFIGSANESATFPVYATSVTGAIISPSQVNYNGSSTDNLTIRASELTTAMANKAQDRNIAMLGGGTVSNVAGLLSWNASITFIINGPGAGTTNYIPIGSANMNVAGTCAYVTIDRNSVASLAVSITTYANVPLADNTLVIARRMTTNDVWVGIDGLAYLITDGSDSGTTGVTPASAFSLGIANLHKWVQEIPTGTINASNKSFTLSKNPVSSTATLVFRNGMIQTPGTDYSLTNSNNILFVSAPAVGNELVTVYARGGTVPYVYVQSVTTIALTTSVVSFTPSPVASYTPGIAVFVNGLQRVVNTDFTATASGLTFAFNLNPLTVVNYFYTGVNDNEFTEQSLFTQTLTSGRTIYTYFTDYNHPNLALISFDGVAQFPVTNTYGLTSSVITVNDYRFLDSQTLEVNATSLTTGTVGYIWAR